MPEILIAIGWILVGIPVTVMFGAGYGLLISFIAGIALLVVGYKRLAVPPTTLGLSSGNVNDIWAQLRKLIHWHSRTVSEEYIQSLFDGDPIPEAPNGRQMQLGPQFVREFAVLTSTTCGAIATNSWTESSRSSGARLTLYRPWGIFKDAPNRTFRLETTLINAGMKPTTAYSRLTVSDGALRQTGMPTRMDFGGMDAKRDVALTLPSDFYDSILADRCSVLIEIIYDTGKEDILKFDTRLRIFRAGTMMDFIDEGTRSIPKPEGGK